MLRSRQHVARVVAVLVPLVVLLGVLAWQRAQQTNEITSRVNLADGVLRGSLPPNGVSLDRLPASAVDPELPRAGEAEQDTPSVVFVTCLQCRSADILGRFLSGLDGDLVQSGGTVHVITSAADSAAWAQEWRLQDEDRPPMEFHDAVGAPGRAAVQRMFGIATDGRVDSSGAAYLFDPRGTWRSTFFLGQLDERDIGWDLRRLAEVD